MAGQDRETEAEGYDQSVSVRDPIEGGHQIEDCAEGKRYPLFAQSR